MGLGSYSYFLLCAVSTRRWVNSLSGGSVERRPVGSFVQARASPGVHFVLTVPNQPHPPVEGVVKTYV